MMYGVPVTKDNENKKYRKPAKSLNFGIAYGMGPKKLCEDLNAEGFPMTLDEAKKLYYKYCDLLQVSVKFLRDSGKLAAKQGYLININGRRRYWKIPKPEDFPNGVYDEEYKKKIGAIEREGGNFLIQSVNADITKLAMAEIRDYAKANKVRTHFINAVYDEVVTRTHKDDNKEFHAAKLKIMRDVAERMITTVPMLVDGFVGPYWNK
jgi:DNA polymerase-1